MNSEISNTKTGRKAITKEQVRSDWNSKVTDVTKKNDKIITLALREMWSMSCPDAFLDMKF